MFIFCQHYSKCKGLAAMVCPAGPSALVSLIQSNLNVTQSNVVLTHWSLGDFNEILDEYFSSQLQWLMAELPLWNCPQKNVTRPYQVNIGSGNGLVPSGNKPLPEPMLTKVYVAIWHH